VLVQDVVRNDDCRPSATLFRSLDRVEVDPVDPSAARQVSQRTLSRRECLGASCHIGLSERPVRVSMSAGADGKKDAFDKRLHQLIVPVLVGSIGFLGRKWL